MEKFVKSFGGKTLLFALLNLLLIGIAFMFISLGKYTVSNAILFPTLISLFIGIIFEPIYAIVDKHRPRIENTSAAVFGTILAGFVVAFILYLCHILT